MTFCTLQFTHVVLCIIAFYFSSKTYITVFLTLNIRFLDMINKYLNFLLNFKDIFFHTIFSIYKIMTLFL